MNFTLKNVCLLVALVVPIAAAHADYIVNSGNLNKIAAPATVKKGSDAATMPQDKDYIFGFTERTNLKTERPVNVDITKQGLYGSPLTPGGVSSPFNVYYFHSDPKEGVHKYNATVTFDEDILGIIVERNTLKATDLLLGNPGTIYTDHDARGLERGNGQDSVHWLTSRKLEMNFTTSGQTDDIRVLTKAVPEPGSLAAVAVGLAAFFRRRKAAK